MATRLQHWDKLERHAKDMLEAMEDAARHHAWRKRDIEAWNDVFNALADRPRLTLAERDRLSERFAPKD